jgi:hypothetical protein
MIAERLPRSDRAPILSRPRHRVPQPSDDNCYIKRYHFLAGLSVYWRGQTIMEKHPDDEASQAMNPSFLPQTVTVTRTAATDQRQQRTNAVVPTTRNGPTLSFGEPGNSSNGPRVRLFWSEPWCGVWPVGLLVSVRVKGSVPLRSWLFEDLGATGEA